MEFEIGDRLTVTGWDGPPMIVTGKNDSTLTVDLAGKEIKFSKETTERWCWRKISVTA